MRPDLHAPRKLSPGDRVAVLSPSFAAPGVWPAIHEVAMRRLREAFGLRPVEYPTTRRVGASPAARAADVMAAFADPGIRAVMASIGGDDQITILPYLDPDVARADPKPFLGYSDNTNLLNWLWSAGVAGWHGGSTMVHLGRSAGLHPVSAGSLRRALFDGGDADLQPAPEFAEEETHWDNYRPGDAPPTLPAPGWVWHRPDRVVTGPTWGGNLEVLHWNLAVNRWLRPVGDYAGCVLLLETSEEMPAAVQVFRMLRDAGERGLLAQFPAILVATAKAANLAHRPTRAERSAYRDAQREAILRAVATYDPGAMVVFNVDFGHTDPQWILPYGGMITVDGPARRVTVHY